MNNINIIIPMWQFAKGGGHRVLAKLANEWSKMGYKVTMACYYESMPPYFPITAEVIYFNSKGKLVERIDPPLERPKRLINRISKMYQIYRGMLAALNNLSDQYNVVIANRSFTAFPVEKCEVNNKFYYIQAYEAWADNSNVKGKVINALAKKSYKLPLIRIVNAEIYLNYKEIHSKFVVPPGLDLEIYYPKKDYWKQNRPLVIGCIGRIEEWKGSDDAAQAVEIIQNKGIDVEFRVAFNPVHYAKFDLVKPDGDANLAQYYRDCDVFIAPGKIQLGAIHYPVIESMACGTPVVTTGYYPADNSNAYLVPVSSPDKIAETLEEIYNNYDLAIKKSDKARKCIREFEWSKVADKMMNVIKSNIE